MKNKIRGMVEIHSAVLLFGLAGLFGKFLALPAIIIVLGRTFFAFLSLLFTLKAFKKKIFVNSPKDFAFLVLTGIILAVHWASFFHSIQVSTVAIGLLTFSTFPLFVTFIEPFMFSESLRAVDILTAILIMAGLFFIVPSIDFSDNTTSGAFWGVVSGFTFAVLSLLNRKYVATYDPVLVAFYQNFTACLVLAPFLFLYDIKFTPKDILLLFVLGVFCTALSHTLFIRSLIHVKTQLASVISGLEPVYGIFFAWIFLDEIPGLRTVCGGLIILSSVAMGSFMRAKPAPIKKSGVKVKA